ncbi:uncharacterized protein G2W53_019984 [Senna tora]|uniref:Uncharacterized protein n=1 Tax=Senna tora TaxID=362788 RepID=A0A834TZB9_9FABA|nr:uncharacterized protein G2W53_019984 [Senna tora]
MEWNGRSVDMSNGDVSLSVGHVARSRAREE